MEDAEEKKKNRFGKTIFKEKLETNTVDKNVAKFIEIDDWQNYSYNKDAVAAWNL